MEKASNTILLVEDDTAHAKLIKEKLHSQVDSLIIEPAASAEALRQSDSNCIIKTEDNVNRLPLVVKEVVKKCIKQEMNAPNPAPSPATGDTCQGRGEGLRGHNISPDHERVILEYRPKEDLAQFTINDHTVVGTREETILDVAKRYGIDIPTLCYHPAVSSLGACRICLVEVTVGKMTRLYASCMYPIQEGIIVQTDTERVLKARRMILELLMARCPDSDVIGNMAKKMGVEKCRFTLRHDPDKCILCGLCVRVCEEKIGSSAIGFLQRGINRVVGTPFMELSQVCTGCGECAKICPTGAITIDHIDRNVREKGQFSVAVKCDGCAGYNDRACVNNCPAGALKVMTVKDFISKNKRSISVELRELLKYSLEGSESEGKNGRR